MTLTNRTIRTATAAALASAGLLMAAATAAADSSTPLSAEKMAEIKVILTDAGYTFEEAEFEDGMIEAEGMKDGQEWEVLIDPATGKIVSAETDE